MSAFYHHTIGDHECEFVVWDGGEWVPCGRYDTRPQRGYPGDWACPEHWGRS